MWTIKELPNVLANFLLYVPFGDFPDIAMALGSHQRTLTALLLVLFAICLLLFGESLGGLGGLFQLQGNILTSSSYAVAERHKQRAKHVKEVGYIIDFFGIKSPYHNGPMVLRH